MSTENEKSIMKLVNPEFDFEFMDKSYRLRKATLDKAIQYQNKIAELDKDPASDSKLVAFCVYIMLKDQEPELTEEIVLANLPADLDALEILAFLGFIKSSKVEQAKKIREAIVEKLSGEKSSL